MEEAIASALDLLDVERIPRWADALLGFPKHLGEEASPRPYHTLVIICLRCLALATASCR